MLISKEIAGFSGAKADDLRKAIGKKNRAAMAELEPEFRAGCRASGTTDQVIDWLWTTNERSADYSFNKSHSACYALIAYRTAWLKANYPAEYMAALISSVMSTKDKVPFFVARCEDMGIEILPPDVNLSDHEFTVVERKIRFGLDAVKGVGYQAVEAIKRARDDGRALRLAVGLLRAGRRPRGQQEGDRGADQVRRVRLDRSDPQGACSRCSSRRRAPARRRSRTRRSARRRSSTSAASTTRAAGRSGPSRAAGRPPISHARVRTGRAARGREGGDRPVHLRAPAQARARRAPRGRRLPLAGVADRRDKDWVTVGGIITAAKKIRTRSGTDMMFATLDDLEGTVEILVFGGSLEKLEVDLAVDEIVLVTRAGSTTRRAGRASSPSRSTRSARIRRRSSGRGLRPSRMPMPKPLRVQVDAQRLSDDAIVDLRDLLSTSPASQRSSSSWQIDSCALAPSSASSRAPACGPSSSTCSAGRPDSSRSLRRSGPTVAESAQANHQTGGGTSAATPVVSRRRAARTSARARRLSGPCGRARASQGRRAGRRSVARGGTPGSRRGRARPRRCWRGGRGWSRAASASR